MKEYKLTENQLKELLGWAHSYGRTEQFNIGLFGSDTRHHEPYTEQNAINYCIDHLEQQKS